MIGFWNMFPAEKILVLQSPVSSHGQHTFMTRSSHDWLLKRSAANVHSVNTRCCLKLGLVMSNLAYASQVWNLQTITLCTELEIIKRRATTFIMVRVLFDTELSQKKTRYTKEAGCHCATGVNILIFYFYSKLLEV